MQEYWVWLQLALGVGNRKTDAVLQTYDDPWEFYGDVKAGHRILQCFNNEEVARLKACPLEKALEVLNKCRESGITVLTPSDPGFPSRLINIYETPCALYIKGDLGKIDDEPAVAVVGTRDMTEYGAQAAFKISRDLAAAHVTVVSGMAAGIDACAHKGALASGGRTVAVLGCGVDVVYPSGNRNLYEAISKMGVLLSEYPPGTKPIGHHFPWRNRIIAALSLGLLVVEAPEKSGALISASYALEQGKDVFAVPGSIFHPNAKGTFQLLKDGASPVSCAEDILEVYEDTFPDKIEKNRSKKSGLLASTNVKNSKMEKKTEESPVEEALPKQSSVHTADAQEKLREMGEGYLKIYMALSGEPRSLDTLAEELSMPVHLLASVLTELEILGYAASHPGKRYSL